MSDQLKMDLPVCPSLRAWSVSTLHVAQAAAAQTDRGDKGSAHQTQIPQQEGQNLLLLHRCFYPPFPECQSWEQRKGRKDK